MKYTLQSDQFKRLLKGFTLEVKKDGRNEVAQYQYPKRILEYLHFMEGNGVVSIAGINQANTDWFLKYLENRPNEKKGGGLSTAYINTFINCIKAFVNYIHSERLSIKPIQLRAKKGTSKLPVILTKEEAVEIIEATEEDIFGKRDKCLLILLYGCGLRRSELVRLDVADINLLNGQVHVRKTKNSRERLVPMTTRTLEVVEQYIHGARELMVDGSANETALLISLRGGRLSKESVIKRIQRTQAMCQNETLRAKAIGVHTFRHSIGTHLYNQGFSLKSVALFLGHQSLDSTQIYIQLNNLTA